jgi:predicted nuclease with TOPRIM domain
MPLSDDELKALRLLLQEELRPLLDEMSKRFDEVATQIDGLYQRDEKREQEYLSIREQIKRLEARFA